MARMGSDDAGNDATMTASEPQGHATSPSQAATPASAPSETPLHGHSAAMSAATEAPIDPLLITQPVQGALAEDSVGVSSPAMVSSKEASDQGDGKAVVPQVVERDNDQTSVALDGVVEPDASEEYGDEDGGVIRCICQCDDDDGFTIQCDKCLVWQHCACFGMSQASVPEEYHCEQCDPRPVDVAFAKAHQQKRRDAEARKASLERSIRRNSQAESAAAASTHAQVNMDGKQGEADTPNEAQRGQQVFGVANVGGISRPRKPSQQLDLTSVTFASADGPSSATATPGSARSNRKKGSGPKTSRKSSSSEVPSSIALTPRTAAAMSSTAVAHSASVVSAGRGEDRVDGEDMSDRMEGWQVEFTPTNRNIIADETIQASLSAAMLDLACGSPLKADNGTGNCLLAPVVGRKVKTLASMGVPSEATKGADLQDSCAMPSMAAEYGLSAIGNECIPVQMATSSLTSCSQKTYVKQVSELASASIFNSLLQVTPLPSEPQRPWSASRTFSKPVMHGLFADSSIPAGCFISEYTGELSNADRYRQDPVNQYQWTGTSKPSVHLFPPPLNLCIDARRFGSTSRFARFSCHPNAVLRPIIVTPTELTYENVQLPSPGVESKQNQMFFGLFALTDIPRTHEITLGWEWDDAHIVHILPQLVRNPTLGVLEASGVPPMAPSTGNQRSLERERRNAAIALLVDKGDFPYIGTMFSQKMNTILTVLLSTCLCACIGSAAAPSGHGGGGASNAGNSTASSNNVKRQDCAILQMLRLSQGMNMLNVYIPGSSSNGKTSRKSKAPDFEPLVGKQRWWRPRAMPLTPSSLLDEEPEMHGSKSDDCHRQLDVRYKLLPGGKVGRVEERDFEDAMGRKRLKARAEGGLDGDSDDEGGSNGESRRSNASSLTEPLSGRSDEEDEEDSLLGGDDVTIARQEGGAPFLTRTALPPKKRVSGTRLKAVCSGGDDSDVEFKGRKRHKSRGEQGKEGLIKKGISKSRASPTKNDQERRAVRRQSGKKRRNRRMYEPSSPLTSAPSEGDSESEGSSESDDGTPTTPLQSRLHPTLKRKEIQREASDEQDPTILRRKKKADSESRKKAKLAKKRRRELLGDLDVGSDGSSGPEQRALADGAARGPSPSPARRMAKNKPVKHIEESDDSASADEEGQMVQQRSTDQASQQSAAVGGQDARMQAGMQMAMEPQSMPPAPVPLPTPPSPPPAPVIEVPKAKLSLADYKKRLAERRTTASVQSAASTPLSTPTLPGMASPEKQPLPTIPSSASATQLGFGFPSMSRTAMPESITTPTTYKTDFAPPVPRFARPSTPPRVPSLPSRGGSLSVSSTGSISAMPSAAPKLPPPPPPTPPTPNLPFSSTRLPDKSTPSEQSAPLSASATTQAAPFGAPPMDHESMSKAEGQHPPARPLAIHPGFAPVRTPFESRLPETTSAPPPASTISRPERAKSISQQSCSPPTTPATFNPPRGPRALINSPLTSTGSSATPTPLTAASPSTGPLRSNSGSMLSTSTPSTGPAPTDGMLRHQRQQSSFDGSLPRHGMRNQSPTRPPPLASPTNSMGSSYGLTGSSVPPQTTANHPAGSASSLNDFANVPKGPARMREREKEREIRERDRMDERDYREPIPPPREQWEREREREAYMRDRDWQDRDGREREHSYDRRRLDDDDDRTDNPPIRPPFPPRGAGSGIGRGAFLGSAQGMGGQWPGRARTRGRGSRGGWR